MKAPQNSSDKFFTSQELMTLLQVDKPTLDNWRLKGYLKSWKIGKNRYYFKSDVQALFQR